MTKDDEGEVRRPEVGGRTHAGSRRTLAWVTVCAVSWSAAVVGTAAGVSSGRASAVDRPAPARHRRHGGHAAAHHAVPGPPS